MTHSLNRVCRKEPQFDNLFICSDELYLYLFWLMVGICCHSAGLWSCVPVPDYFTGCCQEPAHNGHYVFNLLRVIKFVWICLNEFVFLDNLLDWMIDSVTHCVRNGILPEYIPLHLISMFNTVCLCVVCMLSVHTTVHLSCWHCHVTYTVSLCCYTSISSSPVVSLDSKMFSYKCSQ